jgi:hypothetical protein
MKMAKVQCALALVGTLLSCHRDPVSPPGEEACTNTCASVACIDPELDSAAIARCESYCLEKFGVSEAQGVDCAEAFSDGMMCLAELSCSEYEDWLNETPDGPCPSARARVQESCEQIFLEPHILPP